MKHLIIAIILMLGISANAQDTSYASDSDTIVQNYVSLYGLYQNSGSDVIIHVYSCPLEDWREPEWGYVTSFGDEGDEQYSIGVSCGTMYKVMFEPVSDERVKVLYVIATQPTHYQININFDSNAIGMIYFNSELNDYKLETIGH